MASFGRYAMTRLLAAGTRAGVGPVMTRSSQTWQQKGIPGSTLPFSINNRYKTTLIMFIYMATGFNAPFLLIRFQLKKN